MTGRMPLLHEDVAAWLERHAAGGQLSSDSRTIGAGDVFFAYPGDEADGRHYISDAIARGAAAVVYEQAGFAWNDAWQLPRFAVTGLKHAAGYIAADYYGDPDRDMFSVAITGTNGKTSCAIWLADLLSRVDGSAAAIGTLGVLRFQDAVGGDPAITGYTTPDAVVLQRKLYELREAGTKAIAIEASSIGLDQGRMNGMHVDAALFTNLSRDHLDYHGDLATYEAAKQKLFDWPGLRYAVINLDDAAGMRIASQLQARKNGPQIIGTSLAGAQLEGVSTLRASNIRSNAIGTTFDIASPFGAAQFRTRLVGEFNVANVLGVIGVLLAKGVAWDATVDLIGSLNPAPGRMQQLGGQDAPMVVIDYAHTPDALEKALQALRSVASHRQGKLWCVFGCGGDRDAGKRPQMGLAAGVADRVIVTSDNPRSESPSAIIEQIVSGINTSRQGDGVQVIEDRANAILSAVRHAARQDVILIAGKGHEATQEIRGRKLPFSDEEHAVLALSARATMKEMN